MRRDPKVPTARTIFTPGVSSSITDWKRKEKDITKTIGYVPIIRTVRDSSMFE